MHTFDTSGTGILVVISAVLILIFGTITLAIFRSKGRSAWIGFALGFLGVIGIIIALLVPSAQAGGAPDGKQGEPKVALARNSFGNRQPNLRRRRATHWLKNLFGDIKKEAEDTQLAQLLKEQTGDPAFLHRTDWITAYGKKDFKTALEEVNQALQIVRNDPFYLALRAMTHYSMKNYTDAQSDMNAALQSNPGQKEALEIREAMKADAAQCRDRAREWSKKEETQRALDELNRAAELEPDNPINFFLRGVIYAHVKNHDAAINDLTRTLQLDPQYPDGQKILQSLKNVARDKGATKEPSGQSFFFICSGNASLIDAYHALFKVGAPAFSGTFGHYYASVDNLEARKQKASKSSIPFIGRSYIGARSTSESHMHEVLRDIGGAVSREVHIAFVSVDQTGISWVRKVYNELLDQAASQGILPPEMYVTKDRDASQFLLGSFKKVS